MPEFSDDVLIVGDGPMGLSAALLLAKNGMSARVLGLDQTPMHKAELHNLIGSPAVPGAQIMRVARQQCEEAGARIETARVTGLHRHGEEYEARIEGGRAYRARYLILACGRNRALAEGIGVESTEHGVLIDTRGRTSKPNVYAGGNLARGITQAAISMGDGAVAAIDILSIERGEPFHDYDLLSAPVETEEPRTRR